MSIKQVRNKNYVPYLETEGFFVEKTPPEPETANDILWTQKLHPNERIYYHHTLSSARRFAKFHNYENIPKDSLDIVLTSAYDHERDLFVGKNEVLVQKDTEGQGSSQRRLRNTIDVYIPPPVPLGHPLRKGGVTERLSIHGVKLMNTGPHSQITNHGFSRQSGDGNFFNY